MNFASSNWAYALFALPLLALFKIWADTRAVRTIAAFASSERLRNVLLGGANPVWSAVHFGLQLLGLGFLIIALTRPQFGEDERRIEQTGRNIFIAVDTSKSMLAGDVSPNRLARAKLAALDLLEKLPGDRVGLIAFAGRAFLQAPLTTDHEALAESIHTLDHTTIPRGGSSLAAAIRLALDALEKMPGKNHGMVIFSDGQETDSAMMEE
ncbi:MAG: VWA domain-containing protein, partial [Verrucomicrobiaceae bacterium]